MAGPESTRPNLNFFKPKPAMFSNEECCNNCPEVIKCIDPEFFHSTNYTINPIAVSLMPGFTVIPGMVYQIIKPGFFMVNWEGDYHLRFPNTFIGGVLFTVQLFVNGVAQANSRREVSLEYFDTSALPLQLLPVVKSVMNYGANFNTGDILDIRVESLFNVGFPPIPANQSYVRGKSLTIEKKLLTI